MFNLGFSELLLLGAIALIFIGPKQLPDVARTIGRFLNELKRASNDFQETFTADLKDDINRRITEHRSDQNPKPPAPADEQTAAADENRIAPHEMGPEAITTPLDQSKDPKHES